MDAGVEVDFFVYHLVGAGLVGGEEGFDGGMVGGFVVEGVKFIANETK